MEIHWIATFLDPSFRELTFIISKQSRLERLQAIEAGLFSMANNMKTEDLHLFVKVSRVFVKTRRWWFDHCYKDGESSEKQKKESNNDPFSHYRSETSFKAKEETIQELLSVEIADYKTISIYNGNERYEVLNFWKHNERRLPILSIIAKRILIIQASSAESERHFSSGGNIVSESRSRLSDTSVESLVVLREAYLNEMWPKYYANGPAGNYHERQSQLQESVSMASIADPQRWFDFEILLSLKVHMFFSLWKAQ